MGIFHSNVQENQLEIILNISKRKGNAPIEKATAKPPSDEELTKKDKGPENTSPSPTDSPNQNDDGNEFIQF